MSFEPKPVTAILGPNGNGKTTILDSLASAFKPNNGRGYIFSTFFRPNTDAIWNDSRFEILHSYRKGAEEHSNLVELYKKNVDRWSPQYARRPIRDVVYIRISDCIPFLEIEKNSTNRINYRTFTNSDDVTKQILDSASQVLNRSYKSYNRHSARGKSFIGVEMERLKYSAISMSAGEQKIFYILDKLFRAPKFSLILIDELDLLLHDEALKKLIKVICERAEKKNLQVIFTTHRESVADLEPLLNIRHIINSKERTLCFNETKPDAIARLTGDKLRPLDIFVEDELAKAIVKKVAAEKGLSKYINVTVFGAAVNCFTAVCGLVLSGDKCEDALFVLDGDVYKTDQLKIEQIKECITGNGCSVESQRQLALSAITQLNMPEGKKPEQYYHQIISNYSSACSNEDNEIIDCAKSIHYPEDSHMYITGIIETLGLGKGTGYGRIVDLLAKTEEWKYLVENVSFWLDRKIPFVKEMAN